MVPVTLLPVVVWITRVSRAAEASEWGRGKRMVWPVGLLPRVCMNHKEVQYIDIFAQITLIARAPLYPVVAFNALPGVVVPGTVPGKHRTQEHPPCHQMRGGIRSRSLRTTGRTEVCRLSAGAER